MNITLGQPYSFWQIGKRDNQEDSRYPNSDAPRDFTPFFLVCDGVGGCEKGEVASHTVCEAFAESLSETDWTADFSNDDFREALNQAYAALNVKANVDNEGMATTLTFVCFHAEGCLAAHVGDSRIYHVRPGCGILYRSDDHSLVNALVHSGNLTPEEAENHPQSNVITRCLCVTNDGQERYNATVMRIDDLQAGDYFFLCSDGVLESITDTALVDILSQSVGDQEKIEYIASLCRETSRDNNTAYLIPLAEVAKDTDETIDFQESEDKEGGETIMFNRRQEQARDVEPDDATKPVGGVLDFFRKLFGK